MDRYHWARRTAGLDPAEDAAEIIRILSTLEFPWDMNQALSFALFRTYAVPSIGRLLFRTGEFTERTQKRYDDTSLLLDAILEHGFESEARSGEGRDALRRVNSIHRRFDISNDDMRYVLSTFVVMPIRWLDEFGWRRLTESERVATANYNLALGRRMGIRDLPETWQEFADLLDDYESRHFAFDPGARAVADATLDLMTTFRPNSWAPRPLVRRFAYGLMDDDLLDAFRYPRPRPAVRAAARAAIRYRGRLVRHLPPRRTPRHVRDFSSVRSYPNGYDVRCLGPTAVDAPQAVSS